MLQRSHFWNAIGVIEGIIALSLVTFAVIAVQQGDTTPVTIAELLGMRITPLGACFATIFAVLWMKCWEGLRMCGHNFFMESRPLLGTLGKVISLMALLALYMKMHVAELPAKAIAEDFLVAALVYESGRVLPWRRWPSRPLREPERVLVLGTGRRASKAWRELRVHHHRSKQLLGFVDECEAATLPPDIASRFLGGVDILPGYFLKNVVDELIIATPMRSCYDFTQRAISIAEAAGVRVVCLSDIYRLSDGVNLSRPAALLVKLAPKHEQQIVAEGLKRGIDIVAAACGLIVLAPLLLAIAVAVKLSSPGPALFVQERYGYARRKFRMFKFRSMVRNADSLLSSLEDKNEAQGPIFKMRNDPRVTSLGRFLRSTSLDELPQLWNVFIGDMSLVGPRPMSVRDVSLFSEAQLMRRFSVRPGITGIWQVSGRSALSFDQWIALDFSYIDEWSLGLDFKILARTVPAVLRRSGAL